MKIPQSVIDRVTWDLNGLDSFLFAPKENIEYNRERAIEYIKAYREAKAKLAEQVAIRKELTEFLEWANKFNGDGKDC